eukprot:gene31029-40365_t
MKPAAYSRRRRNHPLREYLDSTQLQMLKRRNGPTSAESTFTNKWSGIDHRIKMRLLPSKPLDTAEIGDTNEVEEKTAFRRKLLRGGNNNEAIHVGISSESNSRIEYSQTINSEDYSSKSSLLEEPGIHPEWQGIFIFFIVLLLAIVYSVTYSLKSTF